MEGRWKDPFARRHRGRGHGGRGQEDQAEDHDRVGHPGRSGADHVLDRDGGRRDEAHRRAHGRRRGHLDHPGTDHLSGDLCDLEGTGVEAIETRVEMRVTMDETRWTKGTKWNVYILRPASGFIGCYAS